MMETRKYLEIIRERYVFKISDEENIEFDQDHEAIVVEYLTDNTELFDPLSIQIMNSCKLKQI